jgi:hypothetical protein
MEGELNVLRTAASNGFQNQLQHPSLHPQNSLGQQLASPAPSGEVRCETCVIGKDYTWLNNVMVDTLENATSSEPIKNNPDEEKEDTCGLCSSSSCLCEDLGIRNIPSQETTTSSHIQGTKRKRPKSPLTLIVPNTQSLPMEIDFTSSFTNILSPAFQRDSVSSDGCGFCTAGTPCVCLPSTLPPFQSDLSMATPEAHPEAICRGGGKRPQVNNIKIIGGPVPRIGTLTTIASGNGECTGKPGISLPLNQVNSRDMFAMSIRSRVDVILSGSVQDVGDSAVICMVTASANHEPFCEQK